MKLQKMPKGFASDLRPKLPRNKKQYYSAKPRSLEQLHKEALRNVADNYEPLCDRLKNVQVNPLAAAKHALGIEEETKPNPVEELKHVLGMDME
jgi:hypothetical protein